MFGFAQSRQRPTRAISRRVAAFFTIALPLALVACERDAKPDRVVGVRYVCEITETTGRGVTGAREYRTYETSGEICVTADSGAANTRQRVTVRTPEGDTYEVEARRNELISVGQAWPPQ